MSLIPPDINLSDPDVDTTRDYCGNSLHVEDYLHICREAYARALEYSVVEQLPGDVMEFGAYSGFTARILAEGMVKYGNGGSLQLFDSFEGFPQSEDKADKHSLRIAAQNWWAKGGMSAPATIDQHIFQRLAPVIGSGRLFVHKGLFEKTLPPVASIRKTAVVHFDCDLYVSTKYVLDTLCRYSSLQDGTVLLFDEYYCNRANPNFGERAALQNFLAANPRFEITPWFTYSFASAAFFLHDKSVTDQSTARLAQK